MLATSTWNHIVGVYRAGTSMDVYLNGVLDDGIIVTTGAVPAIPATLQGTSTATVKIGYDWTTGIDPFAQGKSISILSNRENEILELLAKGMLYKEIAGRLFISQETVRKHVYHIYEKLHVNNRVEAINKFYGR